MRQQPDQPGKYIDSARQEEIDRLGARAVEDWLRETTVSQKPAALKMWGDACTYFRFQLSSTPLQIWQAINANVASRIGLQGNPAPLPPLVATFINEIKGRQEKLSRQASPRTRWVKNSFSSQGPYLLHDPLHASLAEKWEGTFGQNEFNLHVLAGQAAVSPKIGTLVGGTRVLVDAVMVNGYIITGNSKELPPGYTIIYGDPLQVWETGQQEAGRRKAIFAMNNRVARAAAQIAESFPSRDPDSTRLFFMADLWEPGVNGTSLNLEENPEILSRIKGEGLVPLRDPNNQSDQVHALVVNDPRNGPVVISSQVNLDDLNPADLRRAWDIPLLQVASVIGGEQSSRKR